MFRATFLVSSSCLLVTALTANLHGGAQADELKFGWAVGALEGLGAARKPLAITSEATLKSGDEVQVFINQITPSFVYVLHESPTQVFDVLHSDGGRSAASRGKRYIPPVAPWLILDSATGIERIYLIASSIRLTALEQLLAQPRAPAGSAKAVRQGIIDELARLERAHTATAWSERPVTMGGQVRGTDRPDIADHATEVTAPGYFCRVIVIDHR